MDGLQAALLMKLTTERDALAESHAELVAALSRALAVVVKAHSITNHDSGAPPGRCHRCEAIADDQAVLTKAQALVAH